MDLNITKGYTQADESFIYSSWLKSYKNSPHTRRWSDQSYDKYQRSKIASLLTRSIVIVARPVDWNDGILGWLCYEQTDAKYFLHYIYVKTAYRRNGIAARLVDISGPQFSKYFTHLNLPYARYLPAEFSLAKVHI